MNAAVHYLESIGRRKFVVPLYTELMKRHADFAREAYASARPGYHPITRVSVDAVVHAQ